MDIKKSYVKGEGEGEKRFLGVIRLWKVQYKLNSMLLNNAGSVLRECRNKANAVGEEGIKCLPRPSDNSTYECLNYCDKKSCGIKITDIIEKYKKSAGHVIKHFGINTYLVVFTLIFFCY